MAEIEGQITGVLTQHPGVRAVRLVGSRAGGTPGPLSDWDLAVDVDDFAGFTTALPALVARLYPLVEQSDPLDRAHSTYMLILPGPVKVDLIFDVPHEPVPPWIVRADTLQAIDNHFWDWLYWLASKHVVGNHTLVASEFAKMHTYLLGPLGAAVASDTIETAVRLYIDLRAKAERRHSVAILRVLEREILRGLRSAGYKV